MFQCALTCSSLLMSAGTPGKLQRALTCCSSLIKGSKRTFNFKGLFLKDSAYCKVATLKNKTIFAGPDFAVSQSPAISGTAEICTSATDRKPAFYVLRQKKQFPLQFFYLYFFFSLFKLFSSSFLEELEAVTLQTENSTLQRPRCPILYLLSLHYLCVSECIKCLSLLFWFEKIGAFLFLHKLFLKYEKK